MKRQVRWNEREIKRHDSSYSMEDIKRAWYQGTEVQEFKRELSATAFEVQISQAHNSNAKAYANVLTTTFLACMDGKVPPRDVFKLYVLWNRICPTLRGTERLSVTRLYKAIQKKSEPNDTVVTLYRKLATETIPHEERTELIRNFYEKKAQPDRIFARIQGIADSAVIKEHFAPSPDTFARSNSAPINSIQCQADERVMPSMPRFSLPEEQKARHQPFTDKVRFQGREHF
ncbi:hypothetical protein MHU86_15815 [Fragilaria crotonensis]|nr:hypothetical protein MHU86_15815 [Fragilaria crotonensis]